MSADLHSNTVVVWHSKVNAPLTENISHKCQQLSQISISVIPLQSMSYLALFAEYMDYWLRFCCQQGKSSLLHALIRNDIQRLGCEIWCHKMRHIILSYGAKKILMGLL